MRYRKPLVFAVSGMIAGAASVALMTAFMPHPTASMAQASALAAAHSSAPMIGGPRTAAKSVQPKVPSPAVKPVSVSPTEGSTAELGTRQEILKVGRGDTLLGVLTDAGIERQAAHDSIEALRSVYNPRDLRPGDEVTVTFSLGGEAAGFTGFSLQADPARKVLASRDDTGGFSATEIKAKLSNETLRFEGEIDSSLFLAATEAGVPPRVIAELIKVFSYDVDFQRDIQKGDRFALMFSRKVTPAGVAVGDFELTFASMTLSGKTAALYRFEDGDGFIDYYNEKGESVRKALLRTPINGARLSSGYGMRRHPVLGYSRMHKGIDFAAPTGTPIYAAGDGVIEKAGPFSSYGNYVRIRHNGDFSTAYAHMSGFGRGIKSGVRVRQGDIIGYVGTTGRSTGPHLHYEILKDGSQVNPMGVRFPTGRKLAGKDLKRFASLRSQVDQEYAALPPNGGTTKVAKR